MSENPLGKSSHYADHYDPKLLFAIPRKTKREEIGLGSKLPFHGVDIWNLYELSWLNGKGKPMVAAAIITLPCESPCIFESKSLKLYLNSFNQTRFASIDELEKTLIKDLNQITQSQIQLELILPLQFASQKILELPGACIDDLDIDVDTYTNTPDFLQTSSAIVTETLHSHLLKSNCLITQQPDWGSIMLRYTGKQIDHEGLLRYLISFRQHNEFHEQCVERIFNDILQNCQPEKLSVYARYTRRGGIDINPFRSNFEDKPINYRNFRQ